MTEPMAGRGRPSRPRLRATGLTVFLGIVLLIMAVYTQMAMEMEWRTRAGRIGAGFFPRIVGFTTMALCVLAAVQSLRSRDADEKTDDAVRGHHPWTLLVFAGAGLVLLLLLIPLGAIVASAVFLLATMWLLDRHEHVKRHLTIAVLLPVGLYLLLQVALNAGLPSGILPMF